MTTDGWSGAYGHRYDHRRGRGLDVAWSSVGVSEPGTRMAPYSAPARPPAETNSATSVYRLHSSLARLAPLVLLDAHIRRQCDVDCRERNG